MMPSTLEVVCGPMFAGKTEEGLRRIRQERLAKRRVLALKSAVDTRTEAYIASRALENGQSEIIGKFPATVIRDETDFQRALCQQFDTLVIDEAQFFQESWFLKHLMALLRREHPDHLLVIVIGCEIDYKIDPFGPMQKLIAIADDTRRLKGICMRCHTRGASLTQMLDLPDQEEPAMTEGSVLIGDKERYEIRCRFCHSSFAQDDIEAALLRQPSTR